MTPEISVPLGLSIFPIINIILYIAFLVACIYGFVLFVKLAHLGIEALRIYISKNKF